MGKAGSRLVRVWAAAAFALAALPGCSPKSLPPPVESRGTRTDTVVLWRTDTIIDRDSVMTVVRDDSVIREITRWRVRVRERRDTVSKERSDTVVVPRPYPVETVREIAMPRRWWETALMWLGVAALAAALVFIFVKTAINRK